jgi:hypothetical protein
MRRFPVLTFVLFVGVALVERGVARATIIDDFSEGPVYMQVTDNYPGQSVVQDGLSTSAVIGGERSVHAGTQQLATLSIDTEASRFRFSADSSFGYFTLQYGASTPLEVNLRADGSDQFLINISELTPVSWPASCDFRVKDGDVWSSYDFGDDLVHLNGPGQLTIPFSCFQGDLTCVQSIKIDVARFTPNCCIAFDSITTVPEPGAFALLLTAGLALLAYAWKRGR